MLFRYPGEFELQDFVLLCWVSEAEVANGHIDEMCRFVGENTIILAEVTDEEAEESNSAKITKKCLRCF
ncbi:hypothetical protein CN491_17695 [Bacillus cereus]|uniref:Uncharacterized protein n=1 Tax=Bacillus cereus TaxID=1396 RepID=A0A2A8LM68_BACCE|nr:agmatine deiminase family protein [Bacillus cereus]PES94211.1 hypothetical protein CN491_17695 [Bacillus cereus]PFP75389.1 hypothetical protein COJ95_18065 [Bacillus cereus]